MMERQAAAVRVQAIHRGRAERTRLSSAQANAALEEEEAALLRQLQDLEGAEDAAIRVQAIQRGRRERQRMMERQAAAVRVQAIHRGRAERARLLASQASAVEKESSATSLPSMG